MSDQAFNDWYVRYFDEAIEKYAGLDTTNPKGIAQDAWDAAIEADRKRRGEPVAWRVHPFDYGFGHEGVYALTSRPDQAVAWERKGWEVQPLFTAPQPAEPVKVPSDVQADAQIAQLLEVIEGLERFAEALTERVWELESKDHPAQHSRQ